MHCCGWVIGKNKMFMQVFLNPKDFKKLIFDAAVFI